MIVHAWWSPISGHAVSVLKAYKYVHMHECMYNIIISVACSSYMHIIIGIIVPLLQIPDEVLKDKHRQLEHTQ